MVKELPEAVGSVVSPGQVVGKLDDASLRLGFGLLQDGKKVKATKAGVLRIAGGRVVRKRVANDGKEGKGKSEAGASSETETSENKAVVVIKKDSPTATIIFWVDAAQKRYVPAREDAVVGVVTARRGENYDVDLGSAFPAALSLLAFEGATKRNRPQLEVGDLVYARVTLADKDMDPELECVDAKGKSAGYGPLADGYVVNTSLSLVRRLFNPKCAVLAALGARLPFEVALGLNGRVWIDSASPLHTIVIANAILNSEFLTDAEVTVMVNRLLAKLG
ncbi:exosome complex component rrp40 [Thecamonas trahens ATCC 50062]|uniref:Ribosomal RNA-processing protein 40 n=1 Tax=Thecamonas trahens ATCC 50062 TaxID=461836 RepID=A0A0L0DI69_THETB|nr:exosome complex component rrp40 [Thecamonas trahens ATCC 50062]KNC51003.1 exosome complex component rrp40 [Thecamonas trahens ATCC 50062]|eukprot:XP_013756472.1 exosome complex component rrp40 [Thecamonas trahens ATCC 50062]